jgi:hypothetical protein
MASKPTRATSAGSSIMWRASSSPDRETHAQSMTGIGEEHIDGPIRRRAPQPIDTSRRRKVGLHVDRQRPNPTGVPSSPRRPVLPDCEPFRPPFAPAPTGSGSSSECAASAAL